MLAVVPLLAVGGAKGDSGRGGNLYPGTQWWHSARARVQRFLSSGPADRCLSELRTGAGGCSQNVWLQ